MKVYDVTMAISENMQVYKNKPEKKPSIRVVQDFDKATARESKIEMDVHTGTHIDSPLHMLPEGGTMETLSLETLIGSSKVLDMTHVTDGVRKPDLEKHEIGEGDFILLKTRNSMEEEFNFEFIYLAECGAKYLAEKKIRGVGIDALGVERAQPGHPTHKTLFHAGVLIIEGLRLAEVPEGEYFMVAAPLKVMETEAAPARVLLFEGIKA
ncbi:arylformamidase [Croceifilum oryzae]|uniref:Kynurenine formamidase n=1 Tax=Croceifilum oryzae TaxID=1553429 RepID=A0AAJ1WS97_9BACL|nr:cyclase family protein [Croceifilum oryzae]MDQ0417460.1 arylformamidase [Croceifilum oryzae]